MLAVQEPFDVACVRDMSGCECHEQLHIHLAANGHTGLGSDCHSLSRSRLSTKRIKQRLHVLGCGTDKRRSYVQWC